MSRITIIAGPPGVGKSTMGHLYVPPDMEIIKKDEIIQANKAFHYKLFQQIAIQNWLSTINNKLRVNTDFAFELNLGMPMHWDFAQSLKQQHADHTLNVVLFFTDNLEMCRLRSEKRFEAGGHEVNPAVLENMYNNTLPLLQFNFQHIDNLKLVNTAIDQDTKIVGVYDKETRSFDILNREPLWFKDKLQPFIEKQVTMSTYFFAR
ncbi:MAG: hypothetical protein M3O71_21265 [Bacteroidota bacterium]|nr:hypothetical protein [Bacteroidota bacterium]